MLNCIIENMKKRTMPAISSSLNTTYTKEDLISLHFILKRSKGNKILLYHRQIHF